MRGQAPSSSSELCLCCASRLPAPPAPSVSRYIKSGSTRRLRQIACTRAGGVAAPMRPHWVVGWAPPLRHHARRLAPRVLTTPCWMLLTLASSCYY